MNGAGMRRLLLGETAKIALHVKQMTTGRRFALLPLWVAAVFLAGGLARSEDRDSLGETKGKPRKPAVGVIGVVLSAKTGEASKVKYVIEASPAAAVGLEPGSIILAVNGRSVKGLGHRDVAELLQGKPGSKVKVLVRFPRLGQEADYELKRVEMRPPFQFVKDPVPPEAGR
jgi:S1-C subfamily serine protease